MAGHSGSGPTVTATAGARARSGPGAVLCLAAGLVVLGARAAPAAAPRRIMIVGDSIQAGVGLTRVTDQASHRLQRHGNVVVHNFSSPGALMTDRSFFVGMNRAGPAVLLLHGLSGMDGLVVAVGTNDWAKSVDLARFGQVYATFLAGLPPALPVACLSPPWRASAETPNDNGDTLDDFRDAIRRACTAAGHEYLDGRAAIPGDPAYFLDGLHPNRRGHRAMARFLERQLHRLGWLP